MSHDSTETARHPRPRLTRAAWTDLCGDWQFAHDDGDVGRAEGWVDRAEVFDRKITVPYPPESEMSGVGETGFHPVVWYRLETTAVRSEGERLLLHFGAVDYRAEVWANGEHVASHEGGHSPFHADVTHVAGPGETLVIVVRAEDDPTSPEQPRGKQDWQAKPHAIWYNRTTGIWQPVWLEAVPQTHIAKLHLTPEPVNNRVTAEVHLDGPAPEGTECEIAVSLRGEPLARLRAQVQGKRLIAPLYISALENAVARGPLMWSPGAPNLMDVEVTLLEGGAETDRVASYFGMRDCGCDGGRFLLNGSPVFVRSVLEQGYYPKSHLAAPAEELKREVELIKELGFNAVRIHQKVEDPRFLYWCDRIGVMVWGEMPSAYSYSPDMADRFIREWLSVVDRDKSNPCIVTWVPLNESWGVTQIARREDQQAFASSLYWMTKALDTTRPVISNDGWEHTVSDILGIHDYDVSGDYLATRYSALEKVEEMMAGFGPARRRIMADGGPLEEGIPIMITEFGGVGFVPAEDEEWFGYQTVSTPEDYAGKLGELFGALHGSPILAGYCYTQLTDTMQESNGLLDENRTPKLPIEQIHEMITTPSEAIWGERLDIARTKARK